MTRREQQAVRAAEELRLFCAGLADAGFADLAHRSRYVAGELAWALAELEAERSARVAIQQARDRAVELLGKNADDALVAELGRR